MRLPRQIVLSSLISILSMVLLAGTSAAGNNPRVREVAPGSILVKFKSGKDAQGIADVLPKTGLNVIQAKKKKHGWWLLKLPQNADMRAAAAALRASENVVYAEPNYRLYALQQASAVTPNDPRFGDLWGMKNTGQLSGTPGADIDATNAWSTATSSSILVAVIDTGVDRTHPDLAANMWVNAAEVPNNHVDDDDNGYVDDYYGWDFSYRDNDPMDGDGHGTHVSGTIGAVGNNGVGVAGVCWDVKIMAVKFLDDMGSGTTEEAIDAIDYAVAMGAKVLNNSWGGGETSQALYDSISAANDAGVLFIAAAGNDGYNNDGLYPDYPSSYTLPNIISVAATTNTDQLAYFSNYGASSVDLAAPGDDILSTWTGRGYQTSSGTSMAAPHVTGACALIWGARQSLTAAQVKQLLLLSTDKIGALSGKCVTGGRLNLAEAVELATVGKRLRILSPNGGESYQQGYVTSIDWSADGFGWSAADRVKIELSSNGGSTWSVISGAASLPHDQETFTWTVFGPVGDNYLVRATSTTDASTTDISDGAFSISGPVDHFSLSIASPQYDGFVMQGICTVTAKDANGRTVGSFSEYDNSARFPVQLSCAGAQIEGLSGSGNLLTPSHFVNGVADLVEAGARIVAGNAPVDLTMTAISDDSEISGTSNAFTLQAPPDYFTQIFTTSNNDLSGLSIRFTPDESQSHYYANIQPISSLPTNPSGGSRIALGDDSCDVASLSGGAQIPFYGISYNRFYVSSNGYVTFGPRADDTSYSPTAEHHFSLPRISAMLEDLYPVDGQITWKQLSDRAVVTFNGVPRYPAVGANTFQIEMYFDGKIVLSYLSITNRNGLVGLSEGNGVPSDFHESDLSSYPPRTTFALTVNSGSGSGSYGQGDLVSVSASTPASGMVFSQWTGDSQYLADSTASNTTLVMPGENITITAAYVPALQLLYPSAAGLGLEAGERVAVLWQIFGISAKTKIDILLSNGFDNWTLAEGVAAGKGSYAWNVGVWKSKTGQTVYPDGSNYRIRLVAQDGSADVLSQNVFSIGRPESLEIQSTAQVSENSSTQIVCVAHYNFGPDRIIPPAEIKWSASSKAAKIGKDGALTTKAVSADEVCLITAIYRGKLFTVQSTRQITILNNGI